MALTLLGKGAMPENHPLCLGMMGMHGAAAVNQAIQDADLLLAFGMRFDDRVTGNLKTYSPNSRKIHIDIDASELNKNVRVDVAHCRRSEDGARARLCRNCHRSSTANGSAEIRDWQEDGDQRDIVNQTTRRATSCTRPMPSTTCGRRRKGDALIVTDVGQHQMWEAQYYLHERPRTLITSGGLGTMGFGLPAAIGAKMGCPKKPCGRLSAMAGSR